MMTQRNIHHEQFGMVSVIRSALSAFMKAGPEKPVAFTARPAHAECAILITHPIFAMYASMQL